MCTVDSPQRAGQATPQSNPLTPHFQCNHQEIIFPAAFIDPVGKIAEEWHVLIVTLKVINLTCYAFINFTFIQNYFFRCLSHMFDCFAFASFAPCAPVMNGPRP